MKDYLLGSSRVSPSDEWRFPRQQPPRQQSPLLHPPCFNSLQTFRCMNLQGYLEKKLQASVFFQHLLVLIAFAASRFEVEDEILHIESKL